MVALAVLLLALQTPRDLISVSKGILPIVITAPHGGRLSVPDVPPRKGKNGAKQFAVVADTDSEKLAEQIADELEKRLKARPTLIVARFARKYIDANRPAAEAYEVDAARPVYEAYHQAIAEARADILKRYGKGILFDIHGQGKERDTIFRGTANGRTVTNLSALTGRDGLLRSLEEKGYPLFPACDAAESKENPSFDGGWTVRHYGRLEPGGFDAIQFETGIALRRDRRNRFAADLAEAIAAYARRYLDIPKPPYQR